jgi:chromosome segregation ATPase
MIEPMMYIGIGFLVAGLLVIGVIPLVHARAERLTMRRMEALTPLSMAEIQADKDQLRAEFAMSTRRLEMSVEQLKAKTTNQLTEIGKKSDAIGRLKLQLSEQSAALVAAEANEKRATDELQALRADLSSKSGSYVETERLLADTRAELAQASRQLQEKALLAESQNVQLLALRAEAEALKGQIESYEMEARQLQERLQSKTAEAQSLTDALAEERRKAEHFGNLAGELERQLTAQGTESELLGRRVTELSARLDEQGRFLADREFDLDRLRNEMSSAQNAESELRTTLAEAENRHRLGTEAIRGEKGSLEEQLKQSQNERGKLQREIASLKQDAEKAWANERVENALLRERINDVAAEVTRLTAALEGPSSPIAAILEKDAAHSPAVSRGGNGGSIAPQLGEPKGTLADRIRALQTRASQLPHARGA